MDASRNRLLVLLAAIALLTGALAGPLGIVPGTVIAGTTTVAAGAPLGDPGHVAPPPAPRHQVQAPTGLWSVPAEPLRSAALVASLLLAGMCVPIPLARSRHALPSRRAPPRVAFPR